jgi:hypothetical protein
MKRNRVILILVGAMLVTVACAFPLVVSNNENEVADAVAETVQAALAQTQAAATYTPLPTLTPQPTYTPYPTTTVHNPPAPAPQTCDQASFISETVADYTKFKPGDEFTKSWRLKNTGTCTWNPDYKLVFYSGDRMSGPKSMDLDEYIKPGEYVDIVIDLEAPSEGGTYTGYWKLQSDDGDNFAQVYVTIKVVDTFAVTSVSLDADPNDFSGACPDTEIFKIDADITSSSAGKVTYRWEFSDGTTSALKSVKFDSKGTKTVSIDWEIDITADDTYSVELYIDNPNHQTFGPLDIDVNCE